MTTLQSTELSAVNIILSNLGEAPVNTLTGDIPLEASQALGVLREVSLEVQKRGWYFNTEERYLTPDTSGFLYLPKSTLQVRSTAADRLTPIVQRGDRVYNMTPYEQSFVFDKKLAVLIVLGLPFTDLPQTARSYILIRASRVFQIRQLGDDVNSRDDNADELRALSELHQEQTRMEPYSLRDSASVKSALSQIPSYSLDI